jgi:hypothetical protein
MAREPASIRYKNPGAMWGSNLAIKWGALPKAIVLNDGTGQGNNIAVFPTYVQGICAQLDLWRTSKNYKNKKFSDAIRVWSGGNHVESYIKFVCDRVPGMTRNTVMNDGFWKSEMGIGFLKAQAWHEAGKRYPAPDADWIKAQSIIFGDIPNFVNEAKPVLPTYDTKWLQTSLNKLGAEPKLDVDGIVGPKLREAIRAFQEKNKLDVDGLVGPATIREIEFDLANPEIRLPEILLPLPGQVKPDLPPTFWERVVDLFKPKG